jgi:hypothetical protein
MIGEVGDTAAAPFARVWPDTRIFASLEEWRRESMVPLHEWLKTLK